jgi:hypothetical protein
MESTTMETNLMPVEHALDRSPHSEQSELVGTTEAIVETTTFASSASDSGDEPGTASGEELAVPQFSPQASGLLLDETKGDLIAREDFKGTVNDRAFENEWLGAHNDISREAIREELLRTGRYTAHIDEADNLLSDREEDTLAVELGVQITYCVHRGWTKDQKRDPCYASDVSLKNNTVCHFFILTA